METLSLGLSFRMEGEIRMAETLYNMRGGGQKKKSNFHTDIETHRSASETNDT